MPLSMGAQLGPFEILSLIGGGGGEVYRARAIAPGKRIVATRFDNGPTSHVTYAGARGSLASLSAPFANALAYRASRATSTASGQRSAGL